MTLLANLVIELKCENVEHLPFGILETTVKKLSSKPCNPSGLDVATCGVASATGFGPLVTNFSRVVASLATAISTYYFIFAYFFIS